MKEKIEWKVVSKERTSCSMSYHNKKYFRIYLKGEIVTAVPNSLGIFCFKTRACARNFIYWLSALRGQYKILKIKPLSEGLEPKEISGVRSEEALDDFYSHAGDRWKKVPEGTVCYQSIQVLD